MRRRTRHRPPPDIELGSCDPLIRCGRPTLLGFARSADRHAPSAGCSFSAPKAGRGKLMLMDIGVVYPQTELSGDPNAVRQIGTAVENLGFDHLLAYDHVLGAVHADRTPPLTGPYTERDPFH